MVTYNDTRISTFSMQTIQFHEYVGMRCPLGLTSFRVSKLSDYMVRYEAIAKKIIA